MNINSVILIGNLVRDMELKYSSYGMAIGVMSLAVSKKKKDGEEEVSFFDINCFGKTAENLSQYLQKGKRIAVDGELKQNRWEQDGQSRSRVEVLANNIQLL